VKKPKKAVSYRLSETTLKELADIAKRHQVSQADVITVLTHCFVMGWEVDAIDNYFDIARMS
jgi:hypothetical protein